MVDLHKTNEITGHLPIDNIDDTKSVEYFYSDAIAVVNTHKTANLYPGTHYHGSYEFLICHSDMPSSIIDKKLYDIRMNTLTALNPMQEHGTAIDIKGFNACGLHIDKSFLQNIAKSIYGSENIQFSNESFTGSHDISMLIRLFWEELRYKQTGYEFLIENLGALIVGSLIRQIKHNLPNKPHNITNNKKENLKIVLDYMNENYAAGASCTELSKLIRMDKYSFIRSFKAQTGITPYEYLLDLKIEKAKKMLRLNEYSITEISMMCGFSSHSHFTSTFKKKIGISPSEYRSSL